MEEEKRTVGTAHKYTFLSEFVDKNVGDEFPQAEASFSCSWGGQRKG